jgi:hypothetical protein
MFAWYGMDGGRARAWLAVMLLAAGRLDDRVGQGGRSRGDDAMVELIAGRFGEQR